MDMLVRSKPFRINGSIQDKGLTALHGKWTFAVKLQMANVKRMTGERSR